MNNTYQSIRVGLFFILGVALIWVTFETLNDGKVFKDKGYALVAGFTTLKELKSGDEVRMAGVRIGAVESTKLDGRRAVAVLRIQPDVQVANDATATISMAGLIGTNYIAIDLGSPSAPALAHGAELKTASTADLNSIMADLGNLGKKLEGALGSFGTAMNGQPGQEGLFQKLDRLVTENQQKVNVTMANLQDITTKLNEGQGTLGKLINDPSLHNELLATVAEIKNTATGAKDFMANAQAIIDQVKSGKGTLGTLIYDDTTGNDIKLTIANLKSVSDKLAKGEGTLGKLINDDTMYQSAQSTLKKADRALDGLSDSGPISAVGVAYQALF